MYSYDVFVSYNKAQVRWVRNLVKKLRALGVQPFFAEEIGLAGSQLQTAIRKAIRDSRSCLVVLTPESARSGWVGFEIERAQKLDLRAKRRFLIPLLLKKCNIPPVLNGIGFVDCQKGLTKNKVIEVVKAIAQRGIAEFAGPKKPSDAWRWCFAPVHVDLSELAFLDQFRALIVGDRGTILRTIDGGRTWNFVESNTTESLYSVAFRSDGKNGWIVGSNGIVLKTNDAGESWQRVSAGLKDDLSSVAWCDGDSSICIGSSEGSILRRKESAKRWQRVRIPGSPALWQIRFAPDGRLGCAVGSNATVLLSQDSGRTWKRTKLRTSSTLFSVRILQDGKTICVVGDEGSIFISRDAGRNWTNRSHRLPLWSNWLNAVDFSLNGQIGWIVGTKGLMLKTTDAGNVWTPFFLSDNPELVDLRYLADGAVWAVGYRGAVLTTRTV